MMIQFNEPIVFPMNGIETHPTLFGVDFLDKRHMTILKRSVMGQSFIVIIVAWLLEG